MTRVIAHRGNSSAAPENTFASFDSAIEHGVTMVECDVQMTLDGHIVVIHDPTLDRTSNRTGDVRALSLAEVQAADVSCPTVFGTKFSPQRVPTLGELLGFLKGRARLMLEIKKESSSPDSDQFERRIAAEIVKSGIHISPDEETDVALLSFATPILERMADILPDAPRGHLFYREPEEDMFASSARVRANFVMPEKGHISAGLVERAKKRGLSVATWVCDDPAEFRELSKLGLLGIGTNRPTEMLAPPDLSPMHIQLDPVGGMAGDMFVAAMLDAFPSLEPSVQAAMRAAGLPERFRCDLVPHADHALNGRRFVVMETGRPHHHPHHPERPHVHDHSHPPSDAHTHDHAPDHDHGSRPFADIRAGLSAAPLDPGVRDHALAIFSLLAAAEARVHGATLDTVSFHELGEWDSIADIVAAAAIVSALGPATWSIGSLPLGNGFVKSAHGLLPVPAPATVLLLSGLAVHDDGLGGERVTPTGAAIVRHLSNLPGRPPRDRRLLGTGLGFGTRQLPGISNCVRVLTFDESAAEAGSGDQVTSIEFEIDDQTPEDLALGLDHVRAHPQVLDVLQMPAFGKKGRVVISVRVLCRAGAENEVAALCFLETTTLGLRLVDTRRRTLSRSSGTADAGGRKVELKRADRGSHTTGKVEAESLRDVAGHEARERLRRAAVRD